MGETRPPGRVLVVLVSAMALFALITAALAARAALAAPLPDLRAALLCVVLMTAALTFTIFTRLGAQRLYWNWLEAALMIGLTLVPPAWVVLLTPVGVAPRLLKYPPIKAIYNLSSLTVAAGAAALVVAAGQPDRPITVAGAVTLASAGLVGGLTNNAAIVLVIARAQAQSFLATARAGAGLNALTMAGNVAGALTVLVIARQDLRLIAVLPVVGVALHFGYVGRLRGREERTAAQRQMEAVDALAGHLDEAVVAATAADQIATLLSADVVEVELHATEGRPAVVHQQRRDGGRWCGSPEQAPPDLGRLMADVAIGRDDRLGAIRVWLIGANDDLCLSERDHLAIRTLAAATGTAVLNARAHEQLRQVAEEQTYAATHDRITDLPIADLLLDQVERHVGQARGGQVSESIALALLDITAFGEIRTTLGRPAAHRLLAHAAAQLRQAVSGEEYLAHVGGDSFAVLLPPDAEPERARRRVMRLLAAVGHPVRLEAGGGQVSLDASAGIAYCGTPEATSGAELLRQATVALDTARLDGIQVAFYAPDDDTENPAALVLAAELRGALERDELELHFQPVVNLLDGGVDAVEALARWHHPTRGLLHPGEFLPVLQRSPRDYARYVRWYLDAALRERAYWGGEDRPVAVNLDTRSLLDPDLAGHVRDAIARVGVHPSQLLFELTEAAALSRLDSVDRVLEDLSQLGVRLAVDDFGSGHSSLTRLTQVPATHLKIDPALVNDMLGSEQSTALVRAAVQIGRDLGLHVTALGVTSAGQVTALRSLGCPAAQGRQLVPALTSGRIRRYLDEAPSRPEVTADVIPLRSRRAADPSGTS